MTKTLLENLMEICEIELARNISLWTNETGMLAPDRVILRELCHEDCSMQGQCVNGKSTNQKSTKYMLIFFYQVITVKITHMRVLMWDCWNSKFRMLFFSIPQEPVNVTQALVVLIARSTQQWHPMCGSWRMLGCVISVTGGAMRWRCLGAHSSSQTISSVNSLVSR